MLFLDDSESALYTVGDGRLVQHNTKTEKSFDIFSLPESSTGTKPIVSQALWKTVEDKTFLLLGMEDGSINISLVPGLKQVISLKSHKKLIQSLVFHPDFLSGGEPSRYRNWLATASNEFQVHLWDLDSVLQTAGAEPPVILVTPTAVLQGHHQRVIELAWSPHTDGQLVSVSYDSSAQVWDVATLSPVHNFQVGSSFLSQNKGKM